MRERMRANGFAMQMRVISILDVVHQPSNTESTVHRSALDDRSFSSAVAYRRATLLLRAVSS